MTDRRPPHDTGTYTVGVIGNARDRADAEAAAPHGVDVTTQTTGVDALLIVDPGGRIDQVTEPVIVPVVVVVWTGEPDTGIDTGSATSISGRGRAGIAWGMANLIHRLQWPVGTLRYGPHADHTIDLRPTSTARNGALAVLIHGGFWRAEWGRDTIEGPAVDLARRGLATAVVGYRRRTPTEAIGPSDMIDDLVAAIGALGDTPDVDTDRIALIGHSAGGHLACLAAAITLPRLTVSMGGVLDLGLAVESRIGDDAARRMLGSESPDAWSPVRIAHRIPNLVVVHGIRDDLVPVEHAQRMLAAASGATSVLDRRAGHFDVLDGTSALWRRTADLVIDRLTT